MWWILHVIFEPLRKSVTTVKNSHFLNSLMRSWWTCLEVVYASTDGYKSSRLDGRYKSSIISTEDTAILELSLQFRNVMSCPEYQVVGTQGWTIFTDEIQCSEVHVCGEIASLHVLGGCSAATVLLQVQIENSCRYSFVFQQMSLKHRWKNPIMGNTRCQYVFLMSFSQQQMKLSLSMQRLSVCTVYIYTGIWRQFFAQFCKLWLVNSVWALDVWTIPSKLSFTFIKVRGALCQYKCPDQLCCCLNKEVQLNA